MATNEQIREPTAVANFIENAFLTYFIPEATNLDLEEAFKGVDDTKALFESIKRRDTLFFDETIDMLLVLRVPLVDEKTLRSHFSRLVIQLETQIVNSHASDREKPSMDIIFQGTVNDTSDPFIVVDQPEVEDDEDPSAEKDEYAGKRNGHRREPHMYAVWKLPVFLARPRIRLQGPFAIFTATAGIRPASAGTPGSATPLSPNFPIGGGSGAGYLQSGVPSGLNLLEPFTNDPALGGVVPRLSALRVSRVAPMTQSKDTTRPLRALSQLRVRIYPAVHTRVRFSRPNTMPTSPALIALLEIDFTPYFECPIDLTSITLSIADGGVVEDLSGPAGLALPMTCVSHDHVTFLFRLSPQQLDLPSKNPSRDLDIHVEAVIQRNPGICTPRLSMTWATTLDFTLPVNPGFNAAMQPMQPIQRSHRPSQLSISGMEAAQSLVAPAVSRPDSLPALEAATRTVEAPLPELGITMTFCGPTEPVYAGEVFSWTVYVVNRSAEKANNPGVAPRKLALVALSKRRRNEVRLMRPPSTSGKGKTAADARELADAVLDENVLHAMQHNSAVDATEVVCLTADTRVGPLAPGACHVVDLQFLPLKEGLVSIEAVRVIDLGSQEHVDVKDLPVMFVEKRPEEQKPE
ncbi:TRAPP trafficking subunit Trs65-domain-containing protein [Colletotrichum navitas]|uniref:TRAPP trafficking subunit Trs65-domain-containing protein n=1 Tax=Colletotrichum navitas TaxID=681940 RepID=A0AAD8Q972_9PEZI|nr:TRAPP trafficking subunit Trs65-domain-containing protein [Colletotrichum navitas]KAK1597939.1 TRAPP trafficking subunit Trs65-domain-containing protein [Colletotrichum navitas]